jgi:hypothetical protein
VSPCNLFLALSPASSSLALKRKDEERKEEKEERKKRTTDGAIVKPGVGDAHNAQKSI